MNPLIENKSLQMFYYYLNNSNNNCQLLNKIILAMNVHVNKNLHNLILLILI